MNQFLSRRATLASAPQTCQAPSFLLLRNALSGYFAPMRKMTIWLVICASLALSFPARAAEPFNTEDAPFNSLVDDYLDGYLRCRPLLGTSLGLHQYDGK